MTTIGSMTRMEMTMLETDMTMADAATTAPETETVAAAPPAVRPSGFPPAPRDANGRFLPGSPGRQPGARNRLSGRVTRELLRNFEANQDELVARMQRWFLPQYMQLIGRLLLKGGVEAADELDAAEQEALAAREAG